YLFSETERLLKETEQRNAELAILNSVGEGMAKTLDVKTVTRIVGDKVRDIFNTDSVGIKLLDKQTNLIHHIYEFDKGEGGYIDYLQPFPLGKGLTSKVIQSRKPLVLGTIEEQIANGAYFSPEVLTQSSGKFSQSWLGVPIIVNDQILGMVMLGDYRENVFKENHLRLLQTLSANMGVAIENARLFQAEQQRVAELQLITSIQQGLAAKLDFQAIVDLVGDKLREVFNVPDLFINWYEEKTNLVHYLYSYEHGVRLKINPLPPTPGGLYEKMSVSRQPIVWNTEVEGNEVSGGTIPGTDASKSGISIPVISSNRVLGSVQLENYEREHAYGEADIRLLTTITGSLGAAMENAYLFSETERLLKETEQRNAELAILNSVGEGMAKTLDVKTVTRIVGDKVRDIFNADGVGIMLLDKQTNLIHNIYEYDKGEGGYMNYMQPFALGKGLTTKVIESRQPLMLGTVEDQNAHGAYLDPETMAASKGEITQSWLGVPIIVNDKVLGVVTLTDYRKHAYNENHVRLLQTLSTNMGVAIENARLFQEEQQRVSELQLITSIQQGLAAKLDFQDIVDLVGSKLSEVFQTPDLEISWYDEEANLLRTLYLCKHGEELEVDPVEPSPDGIFMKIKNSHQPLVWNSPAEGLEVSPIVPGTEASKSGVYLPIISSDRVLGIVGLENYERDHAFSEADVRLLTTITGSLGAAMENAYLFNETERLLKETEQRNAELAILNSAGEGMAKTLDVKTVTQIVGDKVRDIFSAHNVSIMLLDHLTNLIHPLYIYNVWEKDSVDYGEPFPLGSGLTSKVIHTRQPLMFDTLEEQNANGAYSPPETEERSSNKVTESWLGVPIIVNDKVLGIVSLGDYRKHAYNEYHVRLLQTLSANMGVAIENARLFQAEQQRVAELQLITSIQQGLAAKLDFQAIVDLVGDELREEFHSPNLSIDWYEEKTDLIHHPYSYEHGKRLQIDPEPRASHQVFEYLSRTRQPFAWNFKDDALESYSFPGTDPSKSGAAVPCKVYPGTDTCKSGVTIPIISNDRAIGMVQLENFERENAFSEADVRLLTTVTASLGAALENAYLFSETERLLKETEQRNAELAILNSVSEAMSETLDVKSVTQIVGDKMRAIFKTDIVSILLLDKQTNLLHYLYEYDKAEGGMIDFLQPFPLGTGLTSKIMLSRKPLLLNTLEEEIANGAYFPPEALAKSTGSLSKSWLGVPIIANDQAIGVVDLADYREHVFNENHLRLLQTMAANMGVAIENARLFQAEQQRVAELQLITSIQQGLAAKLDFQAIVDLVGDKLREVFHTPNLGISWHEIKTNLIHYLYLYEHGKRL
ncbi:MAG: GAF domain-containing protein, partial [Chloroflexota bacterium]